jgi:hypothetical protein
VRNSSGKITGIERIPEEKAAEVVASEAATIQFSEGEANVGFGT